MVCAISALVRNRRAFAHDRVPARTTEDVRTCGRAWEDLLRQASLGALSRQRIPSCDRNDPHWVMKEGFVS